jgi:NTP pyrophosphatase (non-canonical NTP hydrolase)
MGALNDFHRRNIERQHDEAFAPAHSLTALVVCVQEEVGELAGAVLGVTGEKARKKHKTQEDVLDAVADAMTYLSLVAGSVGCEDLEKLLGDTFNMVSRRAGSKVFTTLGQESAPPVSEAPAPAEVERCHKAPVQTVAELAREARRKLR